MAELADIHARLGTVIGGKYLLRSVLGVGGMGAVYEAENSWTRRSVALKLLHPELTNSAEVVERFVAADPYVREGLVVAWRVRRWDTVVGEGAANPIKAAH